ncbi:MAG: metallophosphoesterase family protein [Bacteriovoracia bacterium]
MIKWLCFLIILVSCKFSYSPYTADVSDIELNAQNLKLIQEKEATTPADFKVAVISDTHNYYNDLKKIVKEINKRGPYAFVIVTGDLTNVGLVDEFKKTQDLLAELKYPIIVAAGNHDMISNGQTIFDRLYGPDKLSFAFKNTQFIIFNNNNWEVSGNTPDVDWVERELTNSVQANKLLFAHVPVDDDERFSTDQVDRWRNIVNANGVNYFICGHDHNHAVSDFGNAKQVVVGAASKRVYVELVFAGGGVTHQLINL